MADQVSPDMSASVVAIPGEKVKVTTDVARAFVALTKKKKRVDNAFAYYDGDQPVVYATDMLSAYFKTLNARFIENWCAPVIDAVLERLTLKGFDCGKNKAAETALKELMQAGGLELEAYDVQAAAVISGEGFIIVWPDEDNQSDVEVYQNDPRQVEMFYDPDHPKRKDFAAKWYVDERSGVTYMTLYYSDRIEHYRSMGDERPSGPDDFIPLPEDEGQAVEAHDKGTVPVFHYRRNRRRMQGELDGKVFSLQDMINKLLADMMVASEFAAFKQRWAISNANLSDLKAHPGELWLIPPGDDGGGVAVGQFDATDLKNFIDARSALAESIAIISHTPKHYMTGASQPSGEALMAMDAPLVKKVQHYSELFGAAWRDLAVFYCQLKGIALKPEEVNPVWAPFNIDQPQMESEVFKNYVTGQLPVVTILRAILGWAPDQLDEMAQDQKEQAAAAPPTLGEVALKAAAQARNVAVLPQGAPKGAPVIIPTPTTPPPPAAT